MAAATVTVAASTVASLATDTATNMTRGVVTLAVDAATAQSFSHSLVAAFWLSAQPSNQLTDPTGTLSLLLCAPSTSSATTSASCTVALPHQQLDPGYYLPFATFADCQAATPADALALGTGCAPLPGGGGHAVALVPASQLVWLGGAGVGAHDEQMERQEGWVEYEADDEEVVHDHGGGGGGGGGGGWRVDDDGHHHYDDGDGDEDDPTQTSSPPLPPAATITTVTVTASSAAITTPATTTTTAGAAAPTPTKSIRMMDETPVGVIGGSAGGNAPTPPAPSRFGALVPALVVAAAMAVIVVAAAVTVVAKQRRNSSRRQDAASGRPAHFHSRHSLPPPPSFRLIAPSPPPGEAPTTEPGGKPDAAGAAAAIAGGLTSAAAAANRLTQFLSLFRTTTSTTSTSSRSALSLFGMRSPAASRSNTLVSLSAIGTPPEFAPDAAGRAKHGFRERVGRGGGLGEARMSGVSDGAGSEGGMSFTRTPESMYGGEGFAVVERGSAVGGDVDGLEVVEVEDVEDVRSPLVVVVDPPESEAGETVGVVGAAEAGE
ncbi:hypothetical protein DFJ73DRAFT_961185 [Zopfochytrium polystomum]|nr:hypothetical protein DFJ73DRAFT_961185 [Zopfochytrium polystomum]